MSDSTYQPGTYVKGDSEKVAKNAKQAVTLVFEGYKLKEEPTSVASEPQTPVVVEDAPRPRAPRN